MTEVAIGSKCSGRRVPLEVIASNPSYLDEGWLTEQWTPRYRGVKRAVDVVVSIVVILMSLPLIAVIAAWIKIDSRGPVLYSQNRIGIGGKRFRMYKFRTMMPDAEASGAVYASKNDPRITRAGLLLRRTRLDELPQFWNVLAGHMSIIGPRPERPENELMLEQRVPGFGLRTCVQPGLTGWAQVSAPYADTIEQSEKKLEYDIYYIRNASVTLDLEIILRTVLVVLRFSGQ